MSYIKNAIRYESVSIDRLKPSQRRLREHNRHERRKINKLIKLAGGQPLPVIVTPDYEIIDGHALYEQLKELGEREIFVSVLLSPSAVDFSALKLLFNRIVEDARWNKPNLKLEIQELVEVGYDLELTGFDPPELDAILDLDFPSAGVGENLSHIPPLQEQPIARRGDIFQLGDHRHGCGDARDQAFVDLVRGGVQADVCAIDAPYNVKIGGFVSGKGRNRHREFVAGSGELSDTEFLAFLKDSIAVLKASASARALIFSFMDWRHLLHLLAVGQMLNLPLVNVAVWVKSNPGMGSLYRNQHELCAIFKAGAEQHLNNVELGRFGRNRSNVWQHAGMSAFGRDRDELLKKHPTVKPVALITDILRDVTRRGDTILDTFCGSGTSIIAAEEVGRRCFAVELDPRYVDVAIRRWQQTTGRDAINLATNETFNASARRLLSSPGSDGNAA